MMGASFTRFFLLFMVVILTFSAGLACAGSLDKQFAEAAAAGDVLKLTLLLDQGADINAKNKEGETVLMVAALEGKTDVVKLLLDRGADLRARDSVGADALLYAALGGSVETIKLLIEKGADLDAQTSDGETALTLSRKRGNDTAVTVLEQARTTK